MRRIRFAVLAPAVVLAGVVAGCGAEAADAEPGETVVPAASAGAPAALTDPQIAHVAVTANAIDVAMGELAVAKGARPEVQAFAKTMITDHTAVNEQAAALAKRLGVTPEDNAVSQSLQAGAEEARARLEGLSGAAFDRAYLEREVGYHQAVLDALDQTLIPEASNAELRSLLEGVRPAIDAHLQHARMLQSSLGGS